MSRKQVINYTQTTPSVQHIIVMLTEIFDTSMQFHVALIDSEIIMCVCIAARARITASFERSHSSSLTVSPFFFVRFIRVRSGLPKDTDVR
jgi:hypothetical protein